MYHISRLTAVVSIVLLTWYTPDSVKPVKIDIQTDDPVQSMVKDNGRVSYGSFKGLMQSGRSPQDSLFKQSEAHMSATLFWALLSLWQSHSTSREQVVQHLLSTF